MSRFMISALLSLFVIDTAKAIVFTTTPEPETYEVVLIKSEPIQDNYYGTDYRGFDKNEKMRLALVTNGRMHSVPKNEYFIYNSEEKLQYRSPLFALSNREHSSLENYLLSLNRGCTLTLSINKKTHALEKVRKDCSKTNYY
jgi:hypothetical protein